MVIRKLAQTIGVAFAVIVTLYAAVLYRTDRASQVRPPEMPASTSADVVPVMALENYQTYDIHDHIPIQPDYKVPPIKNGLAPVVSHIPTKQPVVFLGIDDGVYRKPFELRIMKKYKIKASLYLTESAIQNDHEFFKPFIDAGSLVEDHSVSHELMSTLSYEEQKHEICNEASKQQKQFGRRPILFRPPGGDYNITTQRAAADCGMKAVVNWIAKANGGEMQYQIGNKLRAGDIVLMHFRPEFKEDMNAFIEACEASGLRTVLLEDWLSPDS